MLDKIIKILVNRKWKRERFYSWTWGIDENVGIHIITEESYRDRHRFGLRDWEYYDDPPCKTCEYFQTRVDASPCCECKYIRVSNYKRRVE